MRYLIIAAHPDDEVLGCGGTIARLNQEGEETFVAILGEGMTARYDERQDADSRLLEGLRAKSRKVAEFLGVKDLFMHDFPDNRFDTVPLLDIVKAIERVIDTLKPEVVFTHHGSDLNIDHVITFRATLTAVRPTVGCPVRAVHAYEVASSSEWAFGSFERAFRPNMFFDISQTLELKVSAMKLYEGELRKYPHPRSAEALEAIARKWGATVGLGAAEAFETVRCIY